jgi:regulator of sigma E protease
MVITTIIAFIIILSVLVLIHEFGHFLVAKKFGIKVEEFGIGFPPRAYGKKIGETIYSINWLPVGGFVKLYGEDDAGGGSVRTKTQESSGKASKEDIARAFYSKPLWQRMLVVTAGVIMNVILAIVLISFLFATQGVPLPTDKIVITEVTHNSPAEIAGLKKDDRVVQLDGKKITDTNAFIEETKQHKGQEVTLVVEREGHEFTTKLTPRVNAPKNEGAMGVAITNIEVKKYTWYEAPVFGTIEAAKFSWMIITGLASMVVDFVTHGVKPQGVAGPIGVAQLTGEAVRAGWFAVLWFVSLLSLNLAVLNILPIPALDGGRFFFMIIEMVTGKKVSPKYEAYAHGIGLVLLLGLMALVTILDISRLIQGKSILP